MEGWLFDTMLKLLGLWVRGLTWFDLIAYVHSGKPLNGYIFTMMDLFVTMTR